MRLLPILLFAVACLQEKNVSQETSDNSQEYVLRYNGGNMCVVKGMSSVECLPTKVWSKVPDMGIKTGLGYYFANQFPIDINKNKESSVIVFKLAFNLDFTDNQKEFINCYTKYHVDLARNKPLKIDRYLIDPLEDDIVICSDVIDKKKADEEKINFSKLCSLDNQKLQYEYKYNHHRYVYTNKQCNFQLYVNSEAITYLQDKKVTHPDLMQCSDKSNSLMKFKLSDGNSITIDCTDAGIKLRKGKHDFIIAKMKKGKTYAPINNQYRISILGVSGVLKVAVALPLSPDILATKYVSRLGLAREIRTITYDERGEAQQEKRYLGWE